MHNVIEALFVPKRYREDLVYEIILYDRNNINKSLCIHSSYMKKSDFKHGEVDNMNRGITNSIREFGIQYPYLFKNLLIKITNELKNDFKKRYYENLYTYLFVFTPKKDTGKFIVYDVNKVRLYDGSINIFKNDIYNLNKKIIVKFTKGSVSTKFVNIEIVNVANPKSIMCLFKGEFSNRKSKYDDNVTFWLMEQGLSEEDSRDIIDIIKSLQNRFLEYISKNNLLYEYFKESRFYSISYRIDIFNKIIELLNNNMNLNLDFTKEYNMMG